MKMPVVREENGRLVLDDAAAVAVARVVAKKNCEGTLREPETAERVRHFTRRAKQLGLSPAEVVIVVLNVDDPHAGAIAEALMPTTDWSHIRALGAIPFARGLCTRAVLDVVATFDPEAAARAAAIDGLLVVVVDHGVAEVFPAEPFLV